MNGLLPEIKFQFVILCIKYLLICSTQLLISEIKSIHKLRSVQLWQQFNASTYQTTAATARLLEKSCCSCRDTHSSWQCLQSESSRRNAAQQYSSTLSHFHNKQTWFSSFYSVQIKLHNSRGRKESQQPLLTSWVFRELQCCVEKSTLSETEEKPSQVDPMVCLCRKQTEKSYPFTSSLLNSMYSKHSYKVFKLKPHIQSKTLNFSTQQTACFIGYVAGNLSTWTDLQAATEFIQTQLLIKLWYI